MRVFHVKPLTKRVSVRLLGHNARFYPLRDSVDSPTFAAYAKILTKRYIDDVLKYEKTDDLLYYVGRLPNSDCVVMTRNRKKKTK